MSDGTSQRGMTSYGALPGGVHHDPQGTMTASTATVHPPLPTDEDLLALVAAGDRHAFAALYDRTAPRVLGLVTRCLRDPAQSEEVTQEVYLELWQNAARFDGSKGKALSWMLTVARRRAIDRVRASQASRDRDIKIGIRDHPLPFDVVAETIDTQFANDDVRRAMTRLTHVQREAIELAYFDSLTQAEISERLGVKIPTIKTRLRDGLIALRREVTTTAA
ncbi:ECF RNA polymerase sigma factor SigK [Frondihabitans sp. PAMC 28766]|uniref:ECF RNA polymerase sigma factor SigK n=1 Tax=Frondihabitans sp. PAMC 28766 TaxID=1795630 RepID=UPI000A56143D|nr:ECF RNA polymerase sigma factor SigK [Frondihabitans sp. PAMC 28766]